MPGKVDEAKWSEAKTAARKQYPDWDDKNPRFWKVVSSIYKKMGGEFSEQMKKSLDTVEYAERITPSFIEDPRLWVQAIKKSIGSVRWDVEHLGLIVRAYAALGGKLMKSGMSDFIPTEEVAAQNISEQFEKGKQGSFSAVHKYAERVERPGGGWRYVYHKDQGKTGAHGAAEGTGHGYVKVPKKPGSMGVVPEGQASSQGSMAAIVDQLNKRTESAQRASLQNVSDSKLDEMAGHAKSQPGLKKVIAEEKAHRKVKDAKKKAESKEKPAGDVKKSFEDFSDTHYAEVKDTLQKSHPEWDNTTLIERTEAQLRQIYKLRG